MYFVRGGVSTGRPEGLLPTGLPRLFFALEGNQSVGDVSYSSHRWRTAYLAREG